MGKTLSKAIFKKGSTQIKTGAPESFFDLSAEDIDGNHVSFNKFKDKKVIMVVNVACKCGLTAINFKEMIEMHNELYDKGFQILTFPSSEFMSITGELKTEKEIKEFIKKNFSVNFPIFGKTEVNGDHPHPVYAFLRTHSELYDATKSEAKVIPWNFSKFIINQKGKVIKFAPPTTSPKDLRSLIVSELEK